MSNSNLSASLDSSTELYQTKKSGWKYCPECKKNVPISQWQYYGEESEERTFSFHFDAVGYYLGRLIGELVMWIVRSVYFREVTVVGNENIPQSGATIFYGNHQNQFIDPLLMNSYVNRRLRFLMAAKSLKQPIIGTLGRMFDSVPVLRPQDIPICAGAGVIVNVKDNIIVGEGTEFSKCLRDGDTIMWRCETKKSSVRCRVKKVIDDTTLEVVDSLSSENILPFPFSFSTSPRINQGQMYHEVYETLKKSQCIGIFPEGGSHDNTSLLPLKAGVAIFGLGAAEMGIHVKIVPVGLTYLHGHKFRSRAYMEVGKPVIPPQHLVQLFKTNKNEAVKQFLKVLQDALESVTINVPDYSTLKFLHNFRQLYHPLDCFLPPIAYLRLIRRLSHIVENQKDNESFQEFRKEVETYACRRDNLYLKDSQVATLKFFSGEPTSKHFHLLIRRCFTLVVLSSIFFPFIVLGIPIGCCVEYFATKRTRKALAESTVKIVGADVKGSFRIMMSFFFLPLGIALATVAVYFLSNFYAATAVLISLPTAMYISLLLFQEAIIECRSTGPLILCLFSSYRDRYKQLYNLRQALVSKAEILGQCHDPLLYHEMEEYKIDESETLQPPSLFSIRHNIKRRNEFF